MFSFPEVRMSHDVDDPFYTRADAHIRLSNDQLAGEPGRGKVSASMLFAASRFNAWVTATECRTGEQLAASRDETLAYFVEQYRLMLTENLDDYIANFDRYMKGPAEG